MQTKESKDAEIKKMRSMVNRLQKNIKFDRIGYESESHSIKNLCSDTYYHKLHPIRSQDLKRILAT